MNHLIGLASLTLAVGLATLGLVYVLGPVAWFIGAAAFLIEAVLLVDFERLLDG